MLACSSFCFRLFQAGDNNIVVAPHSAVLLSAIFELAFQGSSLRLHLSTRVHHPPPTRSPFRIPRLRLCTITITLKKEMKLLPRFVFGAVAPCPPLSLGGHSRGGLAFPLAFSSPKESVPHPYIPLWILLSLRQQHHCLSRCTSCFPWLQAVAHHIYL